MKIEDFINFLNKEENKELRAVVRMAVNLAIKDYMEQNNIVYIDTDSIKKGDEECQNTTHLTE